MNNIEKYMPGLSDKEKHSLQRLGELYKEWNTKVNVISRKDIDNIYDHHILHALLLTKVVKFKKGNRILDIGTGGGIPGIPLAILYPKCQFVLIDGTRKKIDVVNAICEDLSIINVKGIHQRAEDHTGSYDFVLARAVGPLAILQEYAWPLLRSAKSQRKGGSGLLAYKGGDLLLEYQNFPKPARIKDYELANWIDMAYYKDKKIVYLQRRK